LRPRKRAARQIAATPELGGGCDLPCAALARADGSDGAIELLALIASLDGHVVLRTRVAGDDPRDVGATAAHDLLDGKGGRVLLEDLA
ncbi:MAG: Porphobilinogen deaminase, C-terminal domain, partial [Actinomycetota bacterium]|nr:Porphobilinogen deaminase, C-terminal domain [Actinomycetota bacterium]